MLKKEITYNDLDGNPITETFWFHMSKGEMAEMAIAKEGRAGGFDTYIRRLIESQDGEVLIATFKEIVLSTLGRRSEDNKYFDKDETYTRRFVQSDAYSVLLMELLTDADKMAEFINGVMPKDMRDEAEKQAAQAPQGIRQGEPNPSTPQVPQGIRQGEPNPNTPEPSFGPQTPSGAGSANAPKDDRPEWLKAGRAPTMDELKGATTEQIQEAFRLRAQSAGPVTQEQINNSQ